MRISIWRYLENEKNYPGYQISLDAKGADAMANELRALEEGTASFHLLPPSAEVLAVPNNLGGKARQESYTTLVVEVVPTSNKRRNYFAVRSDFPSLYVEASRAQVEALAKEIQRSASGDFDYAMGRRPENRFTFW